MSREIAGELLLVPVTRRTADASHLFTLRGVSAFIWERIDGKNDLRVILDEVLAEFDVDPVEAERDLVEFVAQLEDVRAVDFA